MGLHVKATNLAQQAGFFEPQRQHNWNIEITGLGTGADADILSLSLAAGFVPQVSNEEVTIPYGNEYVYVAGKAVFNTTTGAIVAATGALAADVWNTAAGAAAHTPA